MNVLLDPGAYMPTRAHELDAGYDLYSRESKNIPPGESRTFDIGVHVQIPAGYAGFIKSKSGLMVKHGILTDGTIDSGFTGSINVKLFNHGPEAVEIQVGQKIAQIVFQPILTPMLRQVDKLEETERGNGGFGSNGKF